MLALRMVIAEDEQAFREGIVHAIDWKLYDIEIVGEAENGRQALDMMKLRSAELLLTDIRMPYVNGLELIREAKAAGLSFHSILLTGYNEFDYAKEAISLGVSDYLVKPCMPHDIVRVVLDTKKKIETSVQEEKLLTEMNRTWNRSIGLLRNQILSQWVSQPLMPLEDRSIAMREFDLALQPEPIVVGRIELDAGSAGDGRRSGSGSDGGRSASADEGSTRAAASGRDVSDSDGRSDSGNGNDAAKPFERDSEAVRLRSKRDLELLRYAALNIADETLRPLYNGKLEAFRYGDELLWIANCPAGGSGRDQAEALAALQHNLEAYLKLTASLALSSVQPSVNDARTAYEEASKAMEARFYQGKGGIFLYSESRRLREGSASIWEDRYLERTENELLAHLLGGQYGAAVDTIDTAIAYLKDQPSYSRSEIIWRVNGIIMGLQRAAKERHFGSIEWQNHLVNWMESVPSMETLDDCSVILQKIVQSMAEASSVSAQKPLHRTVQATLALIKAKYHTNLTLEQAAKETFVSNSYLSSLFKQELGVNFLDYLHQFRVERAKELLREGYKVYAVAKTVGYGEERHFSSTFKKWTGMTPSQFQKTDRQEGG